MEVGTFPQAAVAGIILVLGLIAYIVLTIIFKHHWDLYEVEASRRRRVGMIYFVGSAILWILLLGSFLFLI